MTNKGIGEPDNSEYKKIWEILVKDKSIIIPEWRKRAARDGYYFDALFSFRLQDNPDTSDIKKGTCQAQWEKPIWEIIMEIKNKEIVKPDIKQSRKEVNKND